MAKAKRQSLPSLGRSGTRKLAIFTAIAALGMLFLGYLVLRHGQPLQLPFPPDQVASTKTYEYRVNPDDGSLKELSFVSTWDEPLPQIPAAARFYRPVFPVDKNTIDPDHVLQTKFIFKDGSQKIGYEFHDKSGRTYVVFGQDDIWVRDEMNTLQMLALPLALPLSLVLPEGSTYSFDCCWSALSPGAVPTAGTFENPKPGDESKIQQPLPEILLK